MGQPSYREMSAPYLSIAKRFGVSYAAVLLYSDYCEMKNLHVRGVRPPFSRIRNHPDYDAAFELSDDCKTAIAACEHDLAARHMQRKFR